MTTESTPSSRLLLIIETDDLIRELLVRWLTEAGYSVAADDSQTKGIALVIADVPNPAQAGAALRALHARHGAPILATSGRFRRAPAASEDAARRLGVPNHFTLVLVSIVLIVLALAEYFDHRYNQSRRA